MKQVTTMITSKAEPITPTLKRKRLLQSKLDTHSLNNTLASKQQANSKLSFRGHTPAEAVVLPTKGNLPGKAGENQNGTPRFYNQ